MADAEDKALAKEATEATEDTGKKGLAYDPSGRFTGNGVMFKAKLFGTADVNEPRGDAVCNVAINLLKSAVKNTGEHKQKIIFKVNMSGIVLLDGTSQLKLYEHPVNKISFIAKDPNDNRAFGYIVTEAEGKHIYFGIKTEKASDQVVLSLRDMFQAVFEAKKRDAEEKVAERKESATAAKPAETAAATPTTPTTEPVLGEASDVKSDKAVKREDSSSHLLELLGDLSFDPTPAPTAAAPGSQAWPPQNAAAMSWGNAVPAQSDPFATQPFGQQPQVAFPQQQQQQQQQQQPQAGFQQPLSQPNAQSPFFSQPYTQPQVFPGQQPPQGYNPQGAQSMFGAAQPQQQGAQSMFGAAQPQQQGAQSMFGAAQPQQPAFQQPPQPGVASPFAQQQPVQAAPFINDAFSTASVFQQSAPPTQMAAQSQATNPFAATGNQSFGVLQPQPVPQPTQYAAYGQPQVRPTGNLFSDLNPLPSTNQSLKKDQFFSDVKNPPKPKLNEMQTGQAPAPAPAPTNTTMYANQPMANVTNTPQNYDWLNQLMDGPPANQQLAKPIENAPVGLIAPPPSHNRQRPGQSPLVRPM